MPRSVCFSIANAVIVYFLVFVLCTVVFEIKVYPQ